MKKKLIAFLKAEPVLLLSGLLAVCSMFWVPPSEAYLSYVDFRTLGILFCLMAAVSGLTKDGFFQAMALWLTRKGGSRKRLCILLVILCFAASMLITNDVALITFVPLTLLLLKGTAQRLRIFVVVMETAAANLGSMLTPIGNPQNLYLYSHYGLQPAEFFSVTFPVWGAGFLLVLLTMLLVRIPGKAEASVENGKVFPRGALIHAGIFLLTLLSVFRLIPWLAVWAAVFLYLLLFDRKLIARIDYSLLLTFVFFFLLVGNLGRVDAIRLWVSNLLQGREPIVSAAVSQIISNVPAALMLSGFTDNWKGLLLGTNIGGLGTLIASMASLISFRYYSKENGARAGSYLGVFSLVNFSFLFILMFFFV